MTSTTISRPGEVGRGLGWATVGTLLLKVGNFSVSIVMARLIAPTEFGVFAVALTVWTICGTMAEFGLGTDLVRAKDFQRRAPTVAALGLITSTTLALVMIAGAGPMAAAFDSPASAPVVRVMALSMLAFGLSIVPAAVLQREFRQGTVFGINVFALVVSTSTMIALALHGWGPMALAIGQCAGQATAVIAQYAATRVPIRFGFDRAIAKESARFCLPLAAANMLSWLLLSVDNLIVSRVLGPTELGLYALAFNVSSWPMSAIGQAIRAVALPAFARLDTPAIRSRAVISVSGPLWALSVLMGVLLGTMAVPVISLLYGSRWAPAAAPLVGLAVFGALRVVFDLLATFLIASGATRAVLLVQVWWLAAMVPAMWFGVSAGGLAGAGWAHVGVAVLAVLPAYLYCLYREGVDWRAFLRSAGPVLLAAVPTAVGCALVARTIPTPIIALAVAAGCAAVLYMAPLSRWFRRRVSELRSAPDSVVQVDSEFQQ